ncbi:hypothetical protein PFLUV_G00033170 [Perca fluviatilis]|uniref:Uncharacterized protein n=1 Tax=Perca fluviatilis TaxID=8168 RepID=A0A6A5FNV5_PERFL|nr:hypothetical protein PFLUV_G00033170 [Perca fluviatilis]
MVCLMQGETSIIRAEAETTMENTKERGRADTGHNRLCCRLEWAGVRLWPQEAVNSLENGRCLMGRHAGLHPPTHHPKMTPDPFVCLYQTMEVRNSDESLWLCVYTPESRKEGNQPRSAKSGEVRENSCSPPALQ